MFDEKNQPVDIFAEVDKEVPGSGASQPAVMSSEGVVRHGPSRLLLVAVILFVAALGGGGYYLFVAKKAPEQVANIPVVNTTPDLNANVAANVPTNVPEPVVNTSQPTDPILPPEEVQAPPDADADGLSDAEEATYGTNPQSNDTDTDGLSDREEIQVWTTDPKNPDTDGDTFLDGAEVRGLYDPKGPGRLPGAPQ